MDFFSTKEASLINDLLIDLVGRSNFKNILNSLGYSSNEIEDAKDLYKKAYLGQMENIMRETTLLDPEKNLDTYEDFKKFIASHKGSETDGPFMVGGITYATAQLVIDGYEHKKNRKKEQSMRKAEEKKENVIVIENEVTIGDVILEKGDKIKVIVRESEDVKAVYRKAVQNAK